jgi:hypothetical protein
MQTNEDGVESLIRKKIEKARNISQKLSTNTIGRFTKIIQMK